jgi:glycosyltransferase A (GT-A) superfamily protein (DUF2064 family)
VRLILIHACAPSDEQRRKRLGSGAGLSWHRLLALRTLDVAGATGADVRVVSTGQLAEWITLAPRTRAAERVSFALDVAGTHDQRRQAAFDAAFAEGYRQVLLIPGDVPDLTTARLEAAFDALDGDAAGVIGPALDGGVYLVGATARLPLERRAALLHAAWSMAGTRVHLLPPLEDVDSAVAAARVAARLRLERRDLLLRAALADLLGDEALPLYEAFVACSQLDALAAPTLH